MPARARLLVHVAYCASILNVCLSRAEVLCPWLLYAGVVANVMS